MRVWRFGQETEYPETASYPSHPQHTIHSHHLTAQPPNHPTVQPPNVDSIQSNLNRNNKAATLFEQKCKREKIIKRGRQLWKEKEARIKVAKDAKRKRHKKYRNEKRKEKKKNTWKMRK